MRAQDGNSQRQSGRSILRLTRHCVPRLPAARLGAQSAPIQPIHQICSSPGAEPPRLCATVHPACGLLVPACVIRRVRRLGGIRRVRRLGGIGPASQAECSALLLSPDVLGGLLLSLAALGAAQLFTCQFFVERLATIDADLAALVFSAHTLDCGEPRLRLAKVPNQLARVTPFCLRVTLRRYPVTPFQPPARRSRPPRDAFAPPRDAQGFPVTLSSLRLTLLRLRVTLSAFL